MIEGLERIRVVLRTIWHPELGLLSADDPKPVRQPAHPVLEAHTATMQSIGKMREAAEHLKGVASELAKPVQVAETDLILSAINHASEDAADFG